MPTWKGGARKAGGAVGGSPASGLVSAVIDSTRGRISYHGNAAIPVTDIGPRCLRRTGPAAGTAYLQSQHQGQVRGQANMATTEAEQMTFLDKKRFFEKEIKEHVTGKKPVSERKFSYLQEHEVANLRTEEEIKMASMSKDELTRYMEEKLGTDGTDYNKIITSSKIRTGKCGRPITDRLENHDQCDTNESQGRDETSANAEEEVFEEENHKSKLKEKVACLVDSVITTEAVIERSEGDGQKPAVELQNQETTNGH